MEEKMMKAAVCLKYGPPNVLQIKEVGRPSPKDDELLIETKASAVTNSDIFIRSSKVFPSMLIPFRLMIGIFKPRKKIIGLVFSGVVKEVGDKIKRFSPGDEVYGLAGFRLGAYAEYMCITEKDSTAGCVSHKPENVSHPEATSLAYGGALALQFMDLGSIKEDDNILIYGASGTTGTLAVQYGKHLGARVTAVCSGKNLDFVKSLGADELIDYTVTDALEEGRAFNFVLDAVGKAKTSKLKEECKKALTENGKYVSIDDSVLILNSKRLDFLRSLVLDNKIKSVLDKVYSLDEIVSAHEYVEKGHKRGGVAIEIGK